MSNTASQDQDPESLDIVLINTSKPPRYRWHQIILVLRAHIIFNSIVSNGQKGSLATRVSSSTPSYNALNTHDAGDIAEISPDVSLQINSEGSENHDCSHDQILLDTIARMVKEKDLGSLNEFGGVQGIAFALHTDLGNGIQDTDNLRRSITNTYCNPQSPEQGFFHFLFKACNNSTIFLLFLCVVLSFGFGIKEEGPGNWWYDGVTTLLAVLILVSITSVGNYWRARKLKKQSNKKKIICKILKDGGEQRCSISAVREGDIICLTRGDQVPADGLFVDGESLILDDMLDSTIDAQNPFVFSGTEVINGHGRMLATSVGKNTAWSEMMGPVTHDPYKKTPLQARLDKVNNCTQIIALLTSILILVVLFLRYKLGKMDDENGRPETRGKTTAIRELMDAMERIIIRPRGPISTLTTSLAVCLVGLQEGLPFVLTLSIAYWNKKAASNKATVQDLSACVTMGSVTTICTEKIGGPMLNQMEVVMFRIGEEIITEDMYSVVDAGVLEGLCHGIGTPVMVPHTSHSSIDDSLFRWAGSKFGMKMENVKQSCTIINTKILNPEKEGCCVLMKKNKDNGRNMCLHWKGHAATILAMCSHYYDSKGDIIAIDEQRKMVFEQMIKDMGAERLKTIAFAHKETDVELLEENNLILIGLLGLKKRHLEETIQAMKAFTNAGVNITLVSRDNVTLLDVVANECGMLMPNSDRMKLEGENFRNCPNEDRMEMVDRITMMENALPSDKVLLVKCLRQKGHVVAVVGFRTNDTPALKEADVGLTMGTWSTKMARESSAIIWDGSFNFLITIFVCGRCVYNNIQKFIQLELTMIIAGLLIISITTISFGDAPISTIQLFWVNLIVAILGGLALLTEPPTEKLMDKPPVRRTEPLITKAMWRNIVTQAMYQAAILVTIQFKGHAILGINDMVGKTIIFNSFDLCQVFNKFNAREPEKKNMFKGIHQNYLFWVAVGTAVALQVAFIEIASIISITARLNCVQWAICFLIGMVSWVIDWAGKCTSDFITDWIIRPISLHIGFIRTTPPTPLESTSNLELPLINGGSMAIPS